MVFSLILSLFLLIIASPELAWAHQVNTEIGEFYAGMIHPLTSLDYVLLILTTSYISSLTNKGATLHTIFLFPVLLVTTLLLGRGVVSGNLPHYLTPITILLLAPGLIFSNRIRNFQSVNLLVLVSAVAASCTMGFSIGFDMTHSTVGMLFIPGVILSVFTLYALLTAWMPHPTTSPWSLLPSAIGCLMPFYAFFSLFSLLSGDGSTLLAAKIGLPSEEGLKTMMAQKELSVPLIFTALVASLLWGAGHALTPGHGKAIVGAYLIGARTSAWHAVYLGLTVTITHTLGVFLLGAVAIFASRYFLPEDLYPYLGALSGLIVIILGASMLWSRYRKSYVHHHHDNHHPHNHDHHHHGDHGHHDHHGHSHLPPGMDGRPISWKSMLALGISGGLLPCPSALVLLLTAISLQRTEFGMLMVVFFSLGLAGVLTTVGLLFVKGSRMLKGASKFERMARHIPLLSAMIILFIGVIIMFQSVQPLIAA